MINTAKFSSAESMETIKKCVSGWLKKEKFMNTNLNTNQLFKNMTKPEK